MKSIYLFIIFIVNSNLIFSSNYEIERMITDFNGVVTNGINVLCYGNYGIITYSSNKGADWKQLNIGDRYEIKKILHYNNVFYGLTNFGLIKSKDGGIKWEKKDLNNLIGINSFTIVNDKLYLQYKEYIQVYDTNFVLLDDNFLNLDSEFVINNITSDNSNLYFENNSIFLRVNLSNKKIDTILNILTIHKSCQKISKLKIDKENLYALININYNENWIIKSLDKGNTWTYYSKDSTTNKNCFNLVNDSVVIVSRRNSKTNELFNLTYTRLYENLKYQRSDSSNIRYIQSIPDTSLVDIARIQDSYIVVGKNKMIIVSNNNGYSWEFKSFIDSRIVTSKGGNNIGNTPLVPFIKNSSTMFIPQNDIIYKTTNSGVTWLPQNYSDIYEKYSLSGIANYYFDINGNGVILFLKTKILDYSTLITNDNGESYYVVKSTYNQFLPNVNYDRTNINILKGISADDKFMFARTYVKDFRVRSLISIVDDKFKLIDSVSLDSISIIEIIKDENKNLYCFGKYLSNFITNDSSFGDFQIDKYVLLKSNNNGFSWQLLSDSLSDIVRKVGKLSFDYKIVEVVNDKFVFLPNINTDYYYVFSLKDNKIEKLKLQSQLNFENKEQLFQYNSKNYFVGAGDYLYYNFNLSNNSSISDSINCEELFYNWKKINYSKYEYGKDIILTTWSNKNDVYFVMGKSIYDPNSFGTFTHQFNLAKFRDKTLSSLEESVIEAEKAYLYNYKPYPIPAVNSVKSLIYWNSSFKIEEAEIGIFDIFGAKLNNINYSIQKLEAFNGNLIVDCTNIPSGVYFARVALGGENLNIPIVVSK